MPFVSGVFERIYSWVTQSQTGNIDPNLFDQDTNDIAAGLSNCILRDGTGGPAQDIPWNSHKITGLAPGTNPTDAANFGQLSASALPYNFLQNASFNVNQRNVSGTVTLGALGYGHDRWKAGSSGCTYTFTLAGNDTRITITAGSLRQIIDTTEMPGGVFTLSHDGTAPAKIYQGSTTAGFVTTPLTSGTLAANTLTVVEFGPGTILRPRLVAGSSAGGYLPIPLSQDLANCQAYYERCDYFINAPANSGTVVSIASFRVTKANIPSLITSDKTAGTFNYSSNTPMYGGVLLTGTATSSNTYAYGKLGVSCEN